MRNPFRYFNSSPEVIRQAVLLYVRYPLSLRQVEDLLFERGIDICHETVRFWWNRFGPMFAGGGPEESYRSTSLFGLALAPGRSVREGQRANALPVACGRSRRRGARGVCDETAQSQGSAGVSEACDEALWPAAYDRDGSAAFVSSGDGGHRKWPNSSLRSLAQQSVGKLTPAVSAKGRGDGTVQGHQDAAEICLRSRLDPQPLQSRSSPHATRNLQAKTLRRVGRVASTCGVSRRWLVITETSSHLSDISIRHVR